MSVLNRPKASESMRLLTWPRLEWLGMDRPGDYRFSMTQLAWPTVTTTACWVAAVFAMNQRSQVGGIRWPDWIVRQAAVPPIYSGVLDGLLGGVRGALVGMLLGVAMAALPVVLLMNFGDEWLDWKDWWRHL